ncbi:MAG: radical SAM protein [Methanoregula sp.]|nr:radical SAM protein [Methanoregula sp.]
MKVLLIYPNIRGMNMLPPAIALFTAILRKDGHTVELFDSTDYPNPEDSHFDSDKLKEINLNVRPFDDTLLKISFKEEDVYEALEKMVNESKPDLLAISLTEDMYPIGLSLLQKIGHLKIPTLAGGVFPTFAPEIVLANPEVDMVCIGEGEHVIRDLCNCIEKHESYDTIPGLWVKKGNTILKNPMGPPVDINKNPPLDLSIFNQGRLYRPMQGNVWRMFPLETHRGCPYTCTYCNSPSQQKQYKHDTSKNFFRKKSFEKIREEIIHFRDNYQVEAFYLWADTLLAYNDREFDEFIKMYSEFKIPFWCQARPEQITRDRIRRLKEVGLFRMAIGIEHGNDEFRRKVLKRNMPNSLIIENLKILNDEGIPFSVNNIMGFPYETRELTFDTIELNRHINADSINGYSFSPFHGTPLREIAEKEGYISPGLIARSVTRPTMLTMPKYPPDQIEGMRRCFVLYIKLPKERWPDIEKAEKLTHEGDMMWEKLRLEARQYFTDW